MINHIIDTIYDQNYTTYDILCLLFFANPILVSKCLSDNMENLLMMIECYLDSLNEHLNKEQLLLVIKTLHLLIVISRDE